MLMGRTRRQTIPQLRNALQWIERSVQAGARRQRGEMGPRSPAFHVRVGPRALIDCLDWSGPREYTHGEIDRLADACARGLAGRGLRRGESVAILSANRAEFLIAYFGIMRAGLVAVPVNYKFPRDTIDFVLRDSGTRLVLCDRERRRAVPDARAVATPAVAAETKFQPPAPRLHRRAA